MGLQQQLCGLKPLPYWIQNPEKRHFLGSSNINLKRLPHFGGTLDVPSKLGLGSEVAGMLSLLWMGTISEEAAKLSFHTDVQDSHGEKMQPRGAKTFCLANDEHIGSQFQGSEYPRSPTGPFLNGPRKNLSI